MLLQTLQDKLNRHDREVNEKYEGFFGQVSEELMRSANSGSRRTYVEIPDAVPQHAILRRLRNEGLRVSTKRGYNSEGHYKVTLVITVPVR
jgi:hypothetical protein